jgi:hypothetical protein
MEKKVEQAVAKVVAVAVEKHQVVEKCQVPSATHAIHVVLSAVPHVANAILAVHAIHAVLIVNVAPHVAVINVAVHAFAVSAVFVDVHQVA